MAKPKSKIKMFNIYGVLDKEYNSYVLICRVSTKEEAETISIILNVHKNTGVYVEFFYNRDL